MIIKKLFYPSICLAFLLAANGLQAQTKTGSGSIISGVPWFDNHGDIVSAHGAGVIKYQDRYYLFGEKHADSSNVFVGFNCYSSKDLCNWKFESIALPVQDSGRLGPNRVGERVKVMKCPTTGEYVMFMHSDNRAYKDQAVGYAVSKNITGPYKFMGALLFNGDPVRKWDIGTFQDADGSGYVLAHGGEIFKLSADYHSVTEQWSKPFGITSESPAVFKRDTLYYWLGSHLTSWEKNDNFYYTATSLKGPWTYRGLLAPEGTLTWNSQTSFVLPIYGSKGTTFIFMGDRWSFPRQASSATYVWQPLTFNGPLISLPQFLLAWKINVNTGEVTKVEMSGRNIPLTNSSVRKYGTWKQQADTGHFVISNVKGSSVSYTFQGRKIGLTGYVLTTGGYATVSITNAATKAVINSLIDTYCNYANKGLLFESPLLPYGTYNITVTVTGDHGTWSDKRRSDYGSKGYDVALKDFMVSDQ